MYGNISYSMTPEQRQQIQDAVNLLMNLEFLINLEADERQRLNKLREDDADLVNYAKIATSNFPHIFPQTMDIEEFLRDIALYDWLYETMILLGNVQTKMTHTRIALGSEIKVCMLKLYHYIQAAQDTPGMEDLARKMREHYKKLSKKKAGEDPVAAADESGGLVS